MKTSLVSLKSKLKVVARKPIKYVDIYSLTESANSILNGLKVHYTLETMRKDITETYRVAMENKADEMAYLCYKFGDLDSAEKLERIINQYAPILKGFNQAKLKLAE